MKDWEVDLSTDADYRCPTCTTGLVITLRPIDCPNSRFLMIDWSTSSQRYTKLAVTEAEAVSACHALRAALHYAASIAVMCEEFIKMLVLREDNTATIAAGQRGWSAKMAHLPTVYGVSLMWLREREEEKRFRWQHEKTGDMIADPLTKLTAPRVLFDRGLLRRGLRQGECE